MAIHPRHRLVDAERPLACHMVSRCVRREWLFGRDPRTGQDHSHLKPWVSDRAIGLSSLFAVALDASAVMSSHFHLVLLHDARASERWHPDVARRCTQAFSARQCNLDIPDTQTFRPAQQWAMSYAGPVRHAGTSTTSVCGRGTAACVRCGLALRPARVAARARPAHRTGTTPTASPGCRAGDWPVVAACRRAGRLRHDEQPLPPRLAARPEGQQTLATGNGRKPRRARRCFIIGRLGTEGR